VRVFNIEDVDVVVASCDRKRAAKVLTYYKEARFHDGKDYPSFSTLVNHCISESDSELICFCADTICPEEEVLEKLLSAMNTGYLLTMAFRFAMFLINKELIRRIGWFDERFTTGGAEDIDFIKRMKLADIGYWAQDLVQREKPPRGKNQLHSRWKNIQAGAHFRHKWEKDKKLFPEEKYVYPIGLERSSTGWKSYNQSVPHRLLEQWVANYRGDIGIVKSCPCQEKEG